MAAWFVGGKVLRKSIINGIIIVLVLANLVLTAIMMFVLVPALQDSNQLITKVAQSISLEVVEEEESMNLMEDCQSFDLGTKLTIALKKESDGRDHYAVIYPALLLYTKHEDYKQYVDTLEEKKPVITQHIEDVVRRHTANELQNQPDIIRQEVLEDLQTLYDSKFIVQVVFGTTTIQ